MILDDIKLALFNWGHFRNPVNRGGPSWAINQEDVAALDLSHPAIVEAIASYQQFMVGTLEPLSMALHGRSSMADGDIGPATHMLMDIKRCNHPDFRLDGAEASTGSGSWPANCYPAEYPNQHAIKISFDTSGMKGFLEDVFDSQVWPLVHKSFIDIGLKLIREDNNEDAHLQASFVRPNGNWIGLAIVPGHVDCNDSIWQRYDRDYAPRSLVADWVTLIKHETGHNLNLDHTSGGVMNPGIVNNLPVDWFGVGDPSEPTLRHFFGGEPIDVPPDGPLFWTHQGFWDETTGAELKIKLRPPLPREA